MRNYMSSYNMNWPAVRYDETKAPRAVLADIQKNFGS